MIYCVVPEVLADDLLDKLTSYYSADPGVTVIVDRRRSSRRKPSRREIGDSDASMREIRDRRRARIPGELPELATD